RRLPRSERVARKPYRLWEWSACRCRSRVAHPRRPLCRPQIRLPGVNPRRKSRSAKRKSSTSAWGRFTYSTKKTPADPGSARELPARAAAAAEAAAAAAAAEAVPSEVVAAAAVAAVAAVGVAVFRGEL